MTRNVNEEIRIRWTGTARFDAFQSRWAMGYAKVFATQYAPSRERHTGLRRSVVLTSPELNGCLDPGQPWAGAMSPTTHDLLKLLWYCQHAMDVDESGVNIWRCVWCDSPVGRCARYCKVRGALTDARARGIFPEYTGGRALLDLWGAR